MTTDKTINATASRSLTFERAAPDATEIPVVVSTDDVVTVADGPEVLVHSADAIDLSRAPLPIIVTHKANQLNVGLVDRLVIDGGRLRGMATFGERQEAREYRTDVLNGIIRSVSVGYRRIHGRIRSDGVLETTRWQPGHVAMVGEPADAATGFFRADGDTEGQLTVSTETHMEANDMTTNTTATGGDDSSGGVNVVAFSEARREARMEGESAGAKQERARIADIESMFGKFGNRSAEVNALKAECIRSGASVVSAQASLLSLLSSTPDATPSATRAVADDEGAYTTRANSRFEAGNDRIEKFGEGLQRAIEFRGGLLSSEDHRKEASTSEFTGWSLSDMARAWCEHAGLSTRGRSRFDVVGLAFTASRGIIGLGTSDFTGILANVASKSMLAGWDEAGETWQMWCRKGNLADFKRANRAGLSMFSRLDVVPEHAEITFGKVSDRTEYIQLVTYAKRFALSRQAIINDDMNAFSRSPYLLGRAANGTIGDAVYNSLTSASGVGPTLNQDSTALFDASTHKNYDASSGSITVSNIDAGRVKMAVQADPNSGAALNIAPKYLLTPAALATAAEVLTASLVDPDGRTNATGGAQAVNPFRGRLQPIAEARLDGKTNGSTAWYLVADQNVHDTYEVAFLDGNANPVMETMQGWSVDGTEMKVRIDAGVACLDYRGMYRKRGA